jgi:glycosyltransferase involved in cell wall biosynthesis
VRVLVLHSRYLSGAVSGENRVVDDEVRLLREGGHEVSVFFPPRRAGRTFGAIQEGLSAVWSRGAVEHVQQVVERERPDVVHCHNLFPALSPGVLRAAGRAGAAVVMTLHNYRLICLPSTLLRKGKVCEDCLGRLPWRGVVHRCYRGSAAASASLATSIGVHRALGTYERVDLYLAVSEFMRTKHIEMGIAPERVVTKSNFAWSTARRAGPGDYFVFAGRLSREKGVWPLLAAWRHLTLPLLLVGDGPDRDALQASAPKSVAFRGALAPDEMPALLARARALIVPSLWYEGAPRIILEAYAAGVPVLASRIGALPELVEHGASGLLFPPNEVAALATAVTRLADDGESERLGEGAWQLWRARFTPERGLKELEACYRRARDRAVGQRRPAA